MVASARSVVVGLIAGLLLGILLPLFTQLPEAASVSARSEAIVTADSLAALMHTLRNSLQIFKGAVGRAAYKRPLPPTSLKSLHPSSTAILPARSAITPQSRFSSSSVPNMADQKPFLQAIKDRRTIYALNNKVPISDARISELVKDAILHVPSSFNSQSTRIVVLLKKEHETFWDYVLEVLRPMVPPEAFGSTEKKVAGFRAGYGTILFLEDPADVAALQKAFPLYAQHFPDWSEHTNAMHQYALWVALEAEGCGANLQHYNPVIDRKAQEHWKIPVEWNLRAQLVFGGVAAPAGEKDFKPLEERLFIHGADA